jgi:hypothetical protein
MERKFRGLLFCVANLLFIKEVIDCSEIERREKTVYTI